MTSGRADRPRTFRVAGALIDTLAILVFVYGGMGSHQVTGSIGALLAIAWPFLVGRLLAVLAIHGRTEALWPGGVIAWILTWALGIGLRAVSGGGTALPFVLVALGALGGLFLGWRLVAALVRWQLRRPTE